MNTADHLAEKILNTLEGQRFADFYNGKFVEYIEESAEVNAGKGITKDTMLKEITRLFNL